MTCDLYTKFIMHPLYMQQHDKFYEYDYVPSSCIVATMHMVKGRQYIVHTRSIFDASVIEMKLTGSLRYIQYNALRTYNIIHVNVHPSPVQSCGYLNH